MQGPSEHGSHVLNNVPEISAFGYSPDVYLDAFEWPAISLHDQNRSASTEDSLSDCDDLHLDLTVDSSGLWPLKTSEEALLFRYFVTDLAPWFDFCDKDRHFGTMVVQASSTCETLLNAILSVSARHLSKSGSFDPLASDKYQRKCLQILIPALNNQHSLLESTLFAATAILRLFDEMADPVEDRQSCGHILGTHILLRAKENTTDSSLRAASLQVALRQEIFISFLTRTPIPPLADYLNIDRTTSPTDDYTWAVRMIAFTADVLSFCYGHSGRDTGSWQRLNDYLEEWTRCKPQSFRPIHYERKGCGYFPKIWFANDCHIGAQLYSDVCRILLLVHDPRMPSLGLDRSIAMKRVDNRVRHYVRRMCGVAISHPQVQPAASVTGMVIAMCGDRFSEKDEQQQLLHILKQSEAHLTWPHLKTHERLSQYWGL
ncbi:uncharacterized protein K452DRAFT_270538 [Aplosporella prunicola CBS 121167]|uniref:ARCA protein n=1 Tax=Aplosporella prunicola CBS 121167 TaxID=1176127 RepID=A0A6A6BGY6_9PEZI|nr:uncharacterized protein K452DRAFT_270538 [Aplosporella prunicola CBS 121167]KAF2142693.1 hypothetical protein K452DRAFT_270538 [Aplosporella prunicola CBS 121167]